jgi:hypothetical protein
MALLMKTVGPKHTIMVGLFFEMLQLMWYGFGSQPWMMWSAGVLASVSSITYPAISAFVSMHADADKQVIFSQCSGSKTFWCGSGSGSADPCL